MRQNNFGYNFLLLSLYGSFLMGVAAFFLAGENGQLSNLRYNLPLVFLLRLGTFWFCSFVLAILVFLFHARRQDYIMSGVDKARVLRVSAYAFSLGTAAALASTLLLLTFT